MSYQSKAKSIWNWDRLRNDYSAKPMENKFVSSESILLQASLCSYFMGWKIYLFTCKKIAFMSSKKIFQPSLYMNIKYIWEYSICLSYQEIYSVKIFTPCRCLCGAMNFSIYWNDSYTSIVFFYLVF